MGSPKTRPLPKPKSNLSQPILILAFSITGIAFLFLFSSFISTSGFSSPSTKIIPHVFNQPKSNSFQPNQKFLYWGYRIDCPGKHCDTCAGLGHQESSLRCALEEALFLERTFVMPARMCINPIHNKKGILHQMSNVSTEKGWMATSCAMDSLYDLDLISQKIPVILDNSELWHQVLSTTMKLGARGVAHVEGVNRVELKKNSQYANLLLINRTASPLAWFVECKDRLNHSAVMLPYDFLPSMATKKLRDAADMIKAMLGDYDAIHVRRGDILKTRKDRFGVERSRHPHVERDTRPECILRRIAKWIPPGRTLFIASNERKPGYFSPLAARLIMMGAKTVINTFKTDDSDMSLSDDPKKNTGGWMEVVRTESC
ncbi:uncharacterized protein LOC130827558 isoform X2 [Amaranthus tricolor]|uniref:uncharacterized protein LOC130827558 isoform X2 n=1 Tax=Amaranthus tricolor TaxID=29722 RepID=UPI00258CC713|nr:uncharacterized protein LOC130827558 isoform X2 [Amaranthus tricolor]